MMVVKGDYAKLDEALETVGHRPETEIIITSKQSARMLSAYQKSATFRRKRIWCVGTGSAEILWQAGFIQVEVGKADAAGLLEEIDASNVAKKPNLLWLSGADIAFDIEKGLRSRGHRATRVITYQSMPYVPECQHLLDSVSAGRLVAAIAMSARTITLFHEMLAHQKMMAKSSSPILLVQSSAQAEKAESLGFSWVCAEGQGRKALLACVAEWVQRRMR